jgi:hypothetical protein
MSATPSSAYQAPGTTLIPSSASVFHNPPGMPPLKGSLIQLAPQDLLIATTRVYPPGTMLHLHLVAEQHGLEAYSLAMVHWSSETEEHVRCGVFLSQALQPVWLEHFWKDYRKELRYEGQWLIRAWNGDPQEIRDVVVGNYSRSGAQLMTRHQMTEGDNICIGTPENFVRGVVRWCSKFDRECYHVGCELERDSGVRLASMLRFSALDL